MKKKYLIITAISIMLLTITIFIANKILATDTYRAGLILVTQDNKNAESSNEYVSITNKIITNESKSNEIVLETVVTNIRKNPIDYPIENENEKLEVALVVDTSHTDITYGADAIKFIDLLAENNIDAKMSFSTGVENISTMGKEIEKIKEDINNNMDEIEIGNPFFSSTEALENGIGSFSSDAENKVMLVLSYGLDSDIQDIKRLADENPNINMILVLVNQSSTAGYGELMNKNNVNVYANSSSEVDFTTTINRIKELFRNEIKGIKVQNMFQSNLADNFIIQNYETGASLPINYQYTIPSLKGKEEHVFKYKLILKDSINRDNMFKEIPTNNVISVTYDGQTNPVQLEETPKIKIAERYKIKLKAIDEENTVLKENVKFNVEAIDVDGTVIYKKNNLEVDESGLLEISDLAFSNITNDITLKISEAVVPEGYQSTLRQEVKVNVVDFKVTDNSKGESLNITSTFDGAMNQLDIDVLTKKLDKDAQATITMHFMKHDNQNNKLGNVVFNVQEMTDELGQYENEEGISFDAVTNEDGEAEYTFTTSKAKEYYFRIKETQTVAGYKLPEYDITYLLSIDEVDGEIYNSGSGTIVNGDYIYDWAEIDNEKKKVDVYFDFSNEEQLTTSKHIQILKENTEGETLGGAIYSMIVRYEDGGTKKIYEEIETAPGGGYILSRPVQITGRTILEFEEMKAPAGYKLEKEKIQVTAIETENGIEIQESTLPEKVKKPVLVDNDRIAITFVDEKGTDEDNQATTAMSLNLTKADEYGNILGGTSFRVVETDAGGNVVDGGIFKWGTTDENGRLSIRIENMKIGENYLSIYETKTVPGHELINETNPIRIKIILKKVDEELFIASKLINDADGAISEKDLRVQAKNGFAMANLRIKNKDSHTNATNLEIIKIDETTGKLLSNAKFSMLIKYKDSEDNEYTERVTEEIITTDEGRILIKNPIELTEKTVIELKEVAAPAGGYNAIRDKISITLESENGQIVGKTMDTCIESLETNNNVIQAKIKNNKFSTEAYTMLLEINKTDEYQNLLGNVQFDIIQVTDETGTNVAQNAQPYTIITSEKGFGSVRMNGATTGEIYLKIMERNTVPGFNKIESNIIYKLNIESVSGALRDMGSMIISGQPNIESKIKINNDEDKGKSVTLSLDIKNEENQTETRNIKIIKQNESGERLSNAQYSMMIKYSDQTSKNLYENIVTNEFGEYTIQRPVEIQEGAIIELRELTAPKGYQKVNKPEQIKIQKVEDVYTADYMGTESIKNVEVTNNEIIITIEDKIGEEEQEEGKDVDVYFDITKLDEYKNLLGGVEFNIVEVDVNGNEIINGKNIQNVKTDGDGNLSEYMSLKTGNIYYIDVYETKTVPGHQQISKADAIRVKLELTSNSGKIYSQGSEVIKNPGNIANVNIRDKDSKVVIEMDITNKENHNNYRNVQIVKVDEETGEYIEDTTFKTEISYLDEVANEYTEVITQELTTDSTGSVNISTPIEVSYYTSIKITETKANNKYQKINYTQEVALYNDGNSIIATPIDSSEIKEVIDEGDNLKIVIKNKKEKVVPTGEVNLKFNFIKNDVYGNNLGGVEFTIIQTDSYGNSPGNGKNVHNIITDESGQAEVELILDQIGDYYFRIFEERTVPGHKLISEQNPILIKITLGADGEDIVVTDKRLINTAGAGNDIKISGSNKTCSVKLDLVNEEEHSNGKKVQLFKLDEKRYKALSGAIFEAKIKYEDYDGKQYTEKINKALVTDDSGTVMLNTEVEITKLTTIELTEIKAPDGYEIIDKIQNIKLYEDTEGKLVYLPDTKNVVMAIYHDDTLQFQIGNKKIIETPTPSPSITPSPEPSVEPTPPSPTPDVDILPSEYIVEIQKENSENSKAKVEGAKFNITVESEGANYYEFFENLETNSSGQVTQKLQEGIEDVTITIKETEAPEEYKLNEQTYKINVNITRDAKNNIVSIQPNETYDNVKIANKNKIIVTIKDEPNPQILIVKEDKDDNEVKIGGVYFKIQELNSDNEMQTAEEIVTDKEGIALKYVGNKTNGTYYYTIEEPYKPEGYLQNNEKVKIKIQYIDGKIYEPSVEIIEGQSIATIKKVLPNYIEIAIENEKDENEKGPFTLDVIKTDANNINIRLTGAILNVKVSQDDKNTLVKEGYVDEDAKIRIENIAGTGKFTVNIAELLSPEGMQLEGEPREVILNVDPENKAITYDYQEDVTIKINQEERHVEIFLPNRLQPNYYTLVVKTINETTGELLTGVPLEISLDGTDEKYVQSTNQYGQIELTNMEMPLEPTTRTYTIREYAPDNTVKREFKLYTVFCYDTDIKTIVIDTQKTKLLYNTTERIEELDKQYVEVVIPIKQDYYEIEILKKDENGNPLPGVKYNVKVNNEQNEYTTDEEGKILLTDREETGKIELQIKELQTPTGYELNGLEHLATLIRNEEYEDIEITDTMNIEKIEVQGNKIHIELKNEKIDENSIYWTLELNKYGEDKQEKLQNVEFFIQLENSNEQGTIVTNQDGQYIWEGIKVPKQAGEYKYIIQEKQSPDGYKKKEAVELIVTVGTNSLGELEITNVESKNQGVDANIIKTNYVKLDISNEKVNEEEAYTLEILKKDEQGNPLPGAVFNTIIKEIETKEVVLDEESRIETTDDFGKITIGPREGKKVLVEVLELYAPEGYKPNGIKKYVQFNINEETKQIEKQELINITDEKVIIDNEKRVVQIIIDNEIKNEDYMPFTMELTKANTKGELIELAGFKISGPNANDVTVILNDGKYEWKWIEMPTTKGTYQYKIKEILTPTGYQKIPEELVLNLEFDFDENGKMSIVGYSINSVYVDSDNTYIKDGNFVGIRLVNYKIGEIIPNPTVTPSPLPTTPPSVKPIETPIVKPTEIPTIKPTNVPTIEPTKAPTTVPTIKPTETPIVKPTSKPITTPTDKLGGTSTNKPINVTTSNANNKNNTNSGKLPQTGKTVYITISTISVAIVTGGIYLIRKYVLK